jgi:signal peptidase I
MKFWARRFEGSKPAVAPVGGVRRRVGYPVSALCLKQVFGWLVVAGLAYGCFYLSQRYVVQVVQVTGLSMSPSLPDSSWYLLNRLVYYFREPKPRDIVVLYDPEVQGYAIKRIIAQPGDSVYVRDGRVYVNGILLREPYLPPGTKTYPSSRYSAQFWICGRHQYFVLGDNRTNSADSRVYGAVPEQYILGLVSP